MYISAKAISGGKPLTDTELENVARDTLRQLKDSFVKADVGRTQDVLSQRLAEELRLVSRMLDMLKEENRRSGRVQAAKSLHRAEEAVDDVADVVEADDRCAALDDIDNDMARRLTRRSLYGEAGPCDNRRGQN